MDTNILRTFICIIDEGSFAAAARRMGISRSLASKYIADLEADLRANLLTRTTRAVRPTAVGLQYSHRIRAVLDQLDAANEEVRATTGQPSGTLKIGAPIAYAMKVLQPHILGFMETYPDVQLEIILDDGTSNLIGDGFDAVIRIGTMADSTLHARRMHEAKIILVASPDYIAARGIPEIPNDLLKHSTLHYTNLRGPETWPLHRDGEVIYQKVQPVLSSNNPDLLHSMARSGKGIVLVPELIVSEDIAEGRLVPIMCDYVLPEIPINLVYPPGRLMTGALRSFLDYFGRLDLDPPASHCDGPQG